MRIIFILALIIFLCIYYFEKLNIFFKTNPTINSIIIIVLVSGVIFILRQFYHVRKDLEWMNNLVNTTKRAKTSIKSPTFLKYLDYIIKRNSGKLIILDGRVNKRKWGKQLLQKIQPSRKINYVLQFD